MSKTLRLMCVLAHPDDESLGTGGTLARCHHEGIETHVVTATRGERGRFGEQTVSPGPAVVGATRESELRAAARELGVHEVSFLDYLDGELDRADPGEATARIVHHLRRVRPHVVITFGPEGGYGHPDHIAISQLTTAAVVCAADAGFATGSASVFRAHRVAKLYYMAWSSAKWAAYQAAFRNLTVTVDGTERRAQPAPDWQITTRVDTVEFWPRVWRAVQCHRTQLSIYGRLRDLSADHHAALWGSQEFYRAMSCANGGRIPETDLFAGLR